MLRDDACFEISTPFPDFSSSLTSSSSSLSSSPIEFSRPSSVVPLRTRVATGQCLGQWNGQSSDSENDCNDSGDFGDVSVSLIDNVLVSGEIYLGTLNWGDCEICQIFEKLYFVRGISEMMVTMVMVMYLCCWIQCAGVCSDRRGRRIMYERGTGGTF